MLSQELLVQAEKIESKSKMQNFFQNQKPSIKDGNDMPTYNSRAERRASSIYVLSHWKPTCSISVTLAYRNQDEHPLRIASFACGLT